jgi:hypothetical protein
MTLDEILAVLERLGDGDWQILDVRSAAEVGGSRHPDGRAAPPEGRPSPATTPRRPRRRFRKKTDKLVVKIWIRIN